MLYKRVLLITDHMVSYIGLVLFNQVSFAIYVHMYMLIQYVYI